MHWYCCPRYDGTLVLIFPLHICAFHQIRNISSTGLFMILMKSSTRVFFTKWPLCCCNVTTKIQHDNGPPIWVQFDGALLLINERLKQHLATQMQHNIYLSSTYFQLPMLHPPLWNVMLVSLHQFNQNKIDGLGTCFSILIWIRLDLFYI